MTLRQQHSDLSKCEYENAKQKLKTDEEKIEDIKKSFACNATILDFQRTVTGYNYILGEINGDCRIWKSINPVNQSYKDAVYITNIIDKSSALSMMKSIDNIDNKYIDSVNNKQNKNKKEECERVNELTRKMDPHQYFKEKSYVS